VEIHHLLNIWHVPTLYVLHCYTCMTVANSRGKRETTHFAFNTNFPYQCVLHNSTPATPRGNTAPPHVLIIMCIIMVCVYVIHRYLHIYIYIYRYAGT